MNAPPGERATRGQGRRLATAAGRRARVVARQTSGSFGGSETDGRSPTPWAAAGNYVAPISFVNIESMDTLDAFLTWQFLAACIFVDGIVKVVKRATRYARPSAVQSGWFKALLTFLNPALGAVAALPPGFLRGDTIGQRLIVGIGAGTLSHLVYHFVLKRFLPAKGVAEEKTPPAAAP